MTEKQAHAHLTQRLVELEKREADVLDANLLYQERIHELEAEVKHLRDIINRVLPLAESARQAVRMTIKVLEENPF